MSVNLVSSLQSPATKLWSRRLWILAAAALTLAVAVPLVAAVEGWQIDAAGLLTAAGGA